MKNKKNAVIVFCRFPGEGKVKTRLAAETSKRFAARLYGLCAQHTFSECSKLFPLYSVIYIFYDKTGTEEEIKTWVGRKFEYYRQTGNDIGGKMSDALLKVFNDGAEKVVLIGTDIPGISSEIIIDAFNKLESCDCVLGPAGDGGFYLIGMKKKQPGIFNDMLWSNDAVLETLKKRLEKKGLKAEYTDILTDIDTLEDIKALLKSDELPGEIRNEFKKLVKSENIFLF